MVDARTTGVLTAPSKRCESRPAWLRMVSFFMLIFPIAPRMIELVCCLHRYRALSDGVNWRDQRLALAYGRTFAGYLWNSTLGVFLLHEAPGGQLEAEPHALRILEYSRAGGGELHASRLRAAHRVLRAEGTHLV